MGNFRWTLLYNTAKNEYLEVAEVVLDYGVDLNTKKITELTPLHLVIQYGQDIIVQLLFKYWINPNT